jgi:hypothetical protein
MSRSPVFRFALVVSIFALVFIPAALAGKGGGGGGKGGGSNSGVLSLVLLDSTDGVAHEGQRITFDVSTSVASPMVGVRCYQGNAWVYDAYVGFFEGYLFDPWLTLTSSYWVAGVSASCNARLFYNDNRGRENVLATLTFPVAP